MGAWGAGLYSGDFALDLRSTIAAVARLPFDGERLTDILCEAETGAANNPADEDHTIFWLVVADQFSKRGISSTRVRDQALAIIDEGSDLAMAESLGMRGSDLARRQRMLIELRTRLIARSQLTKERTVLKKPQPYLFEAGSVLVYPTTNGRCINPYFPSKEQMRGWRWRQDGWGAVVIVERGRAFGFLAWYRPLTVAAALSEKPDLATLRRCEGWALRQPGTCSRIQMHRMELEEIGQISIDREKLVQEFPPLPHGTSAAVGEISISNRLNVGPDATHLIAKLGQKGGFTHGRPNPTIALLDAIAVG